MLDKYTNERMLLLHPKAIPIFTNFINKAEQDLGITIRITDGFRSFDEQKVLYSKGRTAPGPVVTDSPPGRSYHNYGLAIDIVVMEGENPNYGYDNEKISEIATPFTIGWGGNFPGNFKDRPHFELSFGHTTRDLIDIYYKGQVKNGFVQI